MKVTDEAIVDNEREHRFTCSAIPETNAPRQVSSVIPQCADSLAATRQTANRASLAEKERYFDATTVNFGLYPLFVATISPTELTYCAGANGSRGSDGNHRERFE